MRAEEVETSIGDIDGVGLLDAEMAVIVVTGHGSGEGEGEEQAEECEGGAFDGGVGVSLGAATEDAACFDKGKHHKKEHDGSGRIEGHR
jgi:hypothetical protein